MRKMNFLQIGLGSMGRRRIRCLLHNGIKAEHIFGFDLNTVRMKEIAHEYGIVTFNTFTQAIKQSKPGVLIISTPPNHHAEYLLYAARHKIHFFEDTAALDTGYAKLLPMLDGTFIAAPGCAFRFLPAVKTMRQLVTKGVIGRILAFNHHTGQYLPDWHPWEDYRKSYLAEPHVGACQQAFNFELSWLTHLLGAPVKTIQAMSVHVSDIQTRADDLLLCNASFTNGINGNIMVECISRQPNRTLQLVGTQGNIEWDHQKSELMLYQVRSANPKPGTPLKKKLIRLRKGSIVKGYTMNVEEPYQEEMKAFLDAVAGKKSFPYTFKESYLSLQALFGLEQSARTKKAVTVHT